MSNFEWDNVDVPAQDSSFLLLKDKETILRVGSSPMPVEVHFPEGPGGRKKVNCPGEGCPLCRKAEKKVQRFYTKVINRKDERAYVLEIGPQIVSQIKNLALDSRYGSPTQYDIKIQKEGFGTNTKYNVFAYKDKVPLTAEETANLDKLDMNKLIKRPTPAEIYSMGLEVLSEEVTEMVTRETDDDWNKF